MVAPGSVLEDRYRLDSRIAAGGMGEVWRGTDLALRREVAVKLLLPELARDAEGAARFRAEARHAGMVSHPNIARIYDYSEGDGSDGDNDEPGQSYLVMELVEGPSLADLLADGPVGPAYTLGVLAQVGAGLAAAHAVDLVHRDIKPANLLISKSGLVKITDFGIAHAAGSAPITRTGDVVGTGAYLAPERITRGQTGPAADLYSLGVVAYECLTGERPFTGDPLAVLMAHEEQPLPPLPPEVPEGIAALVADLTAKDPAVRPASAAEVAARAKQLRAELDDIAPSRPDLPALAGAILSPRPQPTPGTLEATAQHAGGVQPKDATLQFPGEPPAAEASDGGAAGDGGAADEPAPERRRGLSGRIGLRTALVAAAIVVVVTAGIAAFVFAGQPSQASHTSVTDRTNPAVRHPHSAAPTTATATPTHGTSDVATAPASAPVIPSTSPYPSVSASPSASPSPSASATPTSSPSQTQSPTAAPTQPTASPSSKGSTGTGTGSSG